MAVNPPSNFKAVRAVDEATGRVQANLTWTNGAGANYYTRIFCKHDTYNSTGVWQEVSYVLVALESWTDYDLYDNSRYQYAICHETESGDRSAWVYSGYVVTHPSPPTVSYSRTGSNVTMTIDSAASPFANYAYVARSTDGGATWPILTRTPVTSGGRATVTASLVGSDTVRFAIDLANVDSDGWGVHSDLVYSQTYTGIYVPNAPSGCSASRASDSQASVTWTASATDATHPVNSYAVERATDDGGWVQVGTATGTSYTDRGISANRRYRYRVRALNDAGWSGYSVSGYIYTTPAAPTKVTPTKTSATAISVAATVNAPYATGYDVEKSEAGGAWARIGTNVALPKADTTSATSVRYRVRSVRGSLASAWAESASIIGIVAPDAPTITSAPSGVYLAGSQVTVGWAPNHPDGSEQSRAEIKITGPSGSSSTAEVTGSSARSYTFTPDELGIWTLQVRTYGLSPDAGAWSEAVSWRTAEAPTLVVNTPPVDGTVIDSMPLTVAWTADDVSGIASTNLKVAGPGDVMYDETYQGSPSPAVLPKTALPLENGAAYDITVTVTNGYGLATAAYRSFETSWVPPAEPAISVIEGPNGSAVVSVTPRYRSNGPVIRDKAGLIEKMTVYGAAAQGTPTSAAPAGPLCALPPVIVRCGKNLLNSSSLNGESFGGVTISSAGDGTLVVDGSDANPMVHVIVGSGTRRLVLPAGDYILSGILSGMRVKLSGATKVADRDDGSAWRFEEQHELNLDLSFTSDAAYTAEPFAPMLRRAEFEDEEFAAYSMSYKELSLNLRALPNGVRDEAEISSDGTASITRRVGVTTRAATEGIEATVGVDAWSTTGAIEDGATVWYGLAEPTAETQRIASWPSTLQGGDVTVIVQNWGDPVLATVPVLEIALNADADSQSTDSIAVQRINPDGTAWTVGDDVEGSVADPLPPLGVPVTYRAIASAGSGATSSNEAEAVIGGREWMLNAGNAAERALGLRYNPEASMSLAHGGESYHFADGGAGGGLPVFYGTTDRDESGSLKFDTIGKEDSDELLAISREHPVAWLRDPFGHRWRAHVRPSVSHGMGEVRAVGLDWDAVRWLEAWDG